MVVLKLLLLLFLAIVFPELLLFILGVWVIWRILGLLFD